MSSPDRPKETSAFAALSPAAKMLVINQFFISFGFSLVVPFIAVYLTKGLGLAPALVGLIIGLRMLSSNGMFLFGGSLADRIGPRPMIIIGCAMRIVAFGLYALFTSVPMIILATFLAGLATAFFNPSIRAYLMAETVGRRAEAFGVFAVAGNVGALVGPIVGGLLLAINFRWVAAGGCALFTLLTIAQIFRLPAQRKLALSGNVLGDWREVVTNRAFLVFTVAGALLTLLNTQLAFAMALEAGRVSGRDDSVTALFVVSALVTMALQSRVTRWCRSRLRGGQALAIGMALTALGWAPIMISAPLMETVHGATPLLKALWLMSPVLLGAVVMALGGVLAQPFTMELMPLVGSERLVGTYYGYYSLIAGLAAAGGSAAIGATLNWTEPQFRWIPFGILLALGVVATLITMAMEKRGDFASSAA
ncbi:MFS transporter [Phenylobacterium immobile]|uniref:MFS transporter n=1 Tax=Phenylobacterium immobile TaxID=21 RepID=UPI000B2DC719|nr:MFS transporter [Phenylobacterium immobile]